MSWNVFLLLLLLVLHYQHCYAVLHACKFGLVASTEQANNAFRPVHCIMHVSYQQLSCMPTIPVELWSFDTHFFLCYTFLP